MMTINRRILLGAMSAAAFAATAGFAHAAGEIRVLNWQGYGTDEAFAVEAFEKKTGVKVVHDYFTSEQEMLTKLRTNPGAYDVVLVNSAYTGQAKDEGLITKIDTSDMPNVKDLAPNMGQNPDLVPNGEVYGVAWTWGATGLAVNTGEVKPLPTSLNVLWDPQYAGKVSIRDDGVEAVQFAAMALGQDMNDVKDLDAVKAKLQQLMPQIKTFWSSENDWNQFFSAGDFTVSTFWSGGAGRSASKGLPVAFIVPDEGAVGWLDSLAIPTASKNQEAARAFINWMIDPEFYVQWAAKGAPSSANSKANAALPDTDFNKKTFADPAVVARVQFMKPLADDKRKAYTELWQDVKTAQ
ncbi:PotD/PotF family extracellular solute-binding protein [Aestuariivirga sp.]|uniref:ABC transporter substrate-binding protein n=1 Tax=Aestuariivirga sp. TaxID=2650926 RepID=UPI00391D4749